MKVQSLLWEDPLEEEMATHSICVPGKCLGQRGLVGCSPQDSQNSHDSETKQQQQYRWSITFTTCESLCCTLVNLYNTGHQLYPHYINCI